METMLNPWTLRQESARLRRSEDQPNLTTPRWTSNWINGQETMVSTSLSLIEACPSWGSARVQPSTNAVVSPGTTRVDRVLARHPQPPQPAKWVLKVETVNSSNWGFSKIVAFHDRCLSWCCCRNITCHLTAATRPGCGAEREGGRPSFFTCTAGRQRRQPQLDCGSGNPRAGFARLGPLDCGVARICHPCFQTMELCLAAWLLAQSRCWTAQQLRQPVDTGSRARESRNVTSDFFELSAKSCQQPHWTFLLVAISRLSQLLHKISSVLRWHHTCEYRQCC